MRYPRVLLQLTPRRVVLRYVVLVTGAMLFSAALYHTLNPSYITGLIPRPPHSFPGGPPGSDKFDDPWHQHGHEHPPNATPEEWRARAEQVKQAFLHAYHGYEQYAAPHDELKSLTNRSIDK